MTGREGKLVVWWMGKISEKYTKPEKRKRNVVGDDIVKGSRAWVHQNLSVL